MQQMRGSGGMSLGIMYWYITGMTVLGSITDIRKKTVSISFLLIVATGVIPIAIWERNVPLPARGFGLLLGAVFYLISIVTAEAVGKGDSVMIGICGAAIGFSATCMVLCVGLLFSSVVSLFLLCIKKAGRKTRIPFYPFLAIGELVTALMVLF